jgi:hypothetical protein
MTTRLGGATKPRGRPRSIWQDGGTEGEVQLCMAGRSVDTVSVASDNDGDEICLGKAREGGDGDASELPGGDPEAVVYSQSCVHGLSYAPSYDFQDNGRIALLIPASCYDARLH